MTNDELIADIESTLEVNPAVAFACAVELMMRKFGDSECPLNGMTNEFQ